jgi:hypothetical protein
VSPNLFELDESFFDSGLEFDRTSTDLGTVCIALSFKASDPFGEPGYVRSQIMNLGPNARDVVVKSAKLDIERRECRRQARQLVK